MPSFFTDEDGDTKVGPMVAICAILVVGFVSLITLWPLSSVGADQRAVVTVFGKVQSTILVPGLHVVNPVADVHKIRVSTKTLSFDNQSEHGDEKETSSLFAATKDLQDVQIAVVANYHIPETSVVAVYQQYQGEDSYQTNKLSPIVRESVKAVSAQYTAEELVTKRSEVSDKMTALISQKFTEVGAVFETFKIVNFEFSPDFTKAIEAKATAVQNAEAAKNKLVQVQYEAEQKVATAEAEAKAIQIQAQAINSQGGADYVALQKVQKWDGKGCTQYCGLETATGLLITK